MAIQAANVGMRKNDLTMLKTMGAFEEADEAQSGEEQIETRSFTLVFDNEPQITTVNGEVVIDHRIARWKDTDESDWCERRRRPGLVRWRSRSQLVRRRLRRCREAPGLRFDPSEIAPRTAMIPTRYRSRTCRLAQRPGERSAEASIGDAASRRLSSASTAREGPTHLKNLLERLAVEDRRISALECLLAPCSGCARPRGSRSRTGSHIQRWRALRR